MVKLDNGMKTLQSQLIKTKGFAFDADTHSYYLDGKPMTGVTTILSVISKNLTWWAAGKALEELGWTNPKFVKREEGIKIAGKARRNFFITNEQYYDWLQDCYRAHDKSKKEAGVHGTDLHALVEDYVKACIDANDGKPLTTFPFEITPFVEWAIKENIRFIASEKQVYSKEKFYAGTMDLVCEKDGKLFIADVKTGKTIYPEYYFQMAAYRLAWQEMGNEPLSGAAVIRMGKDGSFEIGWRYDYQTDLSAFMGALAIYRAKATFN